MVRSANPILDHPRSASDRVRSTATCLVIAGVGLVGATPLLTTPAHAAEIEEAVSNVVIEGNARPGSTLTLRAGWSVPDGSAAGDTFSLVLPSGLEGVPTSFDLRNAAGDVVGTAAVTNGVVTVTLSDYVSQNPLNVGGTLQFYAKVAADAQPGQQIVLDWGQSEPVTITVASGTVGAVTSPAKSGGLDTASNSSLWTVTVPGAAGGEAGLSDVVITDTPNGHQLPCESIRVSIGTVGEGGTMPTSWQRLEQPAYDLQCEGPAGFSVLFDQISADQVVRVVPVVDNDQPMTTNGAGRLMNDWAVTATGYESSGSATSRIYGAGGTGSGETEAPSPSATPSETAEPTQEPTESAPPTENPEPTDEPTVDPSPTQSVEPTDAPSQEPTEDPSDEPSEPEPTETASPEPSDSMTPTQEPSTDPEPSESATEQPSEEPTETASPEPSASETAEPTVDPEPSESEIPTQDPEPTESASATEEPSQQPSETVSSSPTTSAEPTESASVTDGPTASESATSTVSASPSATESSLGVVSTDGPSDSSSAPVAPAPGGGDDDGGAPVKDPSRGVLVDTGLAHSSGAPTAAGFVLLGGCLLFGTGLALMWHKRRIQ